VDLVDLSEKMFTPAITGTAKTPKEKDILEMEGLYYNCFMASWLIGEWTGENRVNDVVNLAEFPKFAPLDAIKYILEKLAIPEEVLSAVQLKVATYSSKLAILTGHDGFRRIKQFFALSMANGWTKKMLVDEIGVDGILSRTGLSKESPWYIENVFRTNNSTAYNAGNWNRYQKRLDKIAFYQYLAINDDRTTPLCDGLDGTTLPVDSSVWADYWPPNHYQCRSEVVAISKARAQVRDQQPVKPKGKLEFPDGNEDFKGNSAKDFGELSVDQVARAKEMNVLNDMATRAREIKKSQ